MIQDRSILKVADNTGAKEIACFKIFKAKSKEYAKLGDVIIASIKSAKPHGMVKKGQVIKAVIVREKFPFQRKDGSVIKFDDNAAVIIEDDNNPKGTKIIGPIAKEVRTNGFTKIVSLAKEVL